MISFLKGAMWGFIIVAVILSSIGGLWWLFPAAVLFGWVVDRVARLIFQGDKQQ
ncbi:MAG: hypothetical protein Q7J42_17725 [Sulfuritalea sp.]|nr:hypothetical protein [Sulfuritalea sp.]